MLFNPSTTDEAKTLIDKMLKFKPILTATIFNRIFSITPLSECLQTCGLDLLQACKMVQSAIGKLEMISRDFPTVLNIATQFAKKAKSKRASFDTDVAVEESLPSKATKRIPNRKLPFGEKDNTDNRAMDAHEDYQGNVFNVVMIKL